MSRRVGQNAGYVRHGIAGDLTQDDSGGEVHEFEWEADRKHVSLCVVGVCLVVVVACVLCVGGSGGCSWFSSLYVHMFMFVLV